VTDPSPTWYCVQFNGQRVRGIKDAEALLKKTAREIFGSDLHEVAVVGERFDDDTYESQSEGYFFVRCTNYHRYVPTIKQSVIISKVLPKTEQPEPVSEEEVASFRVRVPFAGTKEHFDVGDVVRIRKGYLENLFGIVIDNDAERYSVVFKLYTRRFVENVSRNNMIFMGNVEKIANIEIEDKPVLRRPRLAKNKLHRGYDRNTTSRKTCRCSAT